MYNDEGPDAAFTLYSMNAEGSGDFGLDFSESLLLRKGFIDSVDDCGVFAVLQELMKEKFTFKHFCDQTNEI